MRRSSLILALALHANVEAVWADLPAPAEIIARIVPKSAATNSAAEPGSVAADAAALQAEMKSIPAEVAAQRWLDLLDRASKEPVRGPYRPGRLGQGIQPIEIAMDTLPPPEYWPELQK